MTNQETEVRTRDDRKIGHALLRTSANFWFLVMVSGQWIFVAYILGYYGGILLKVGPEGLRSYSPADLIGNAAVIAHIIVGGVIIFCGPLQLITQIRARYPSFHRWNGRVYVVVAVINTIVGLYLLWFRNSSDGKFLQDLGTSIAGILTLFFVFMALRSALRKDFAVHMQWALRLFLVVSAVWFVRLMIYGWIYVTGGIGIDFKTFTGPALDIIHHAQYLLPLATLELYFAAHKRAQASSKVMAAGIVFAMSVLMAVGLFAIGKASWVPKMIS